MPIVFMVPVFGGDKLVIPAKVGLIGVIVITVFPISGYVANFPSGLEYFGLLIKELAVGTVLALSANCLFEALTIGGQLIDNLRGDNKSASANIYSNNKSSPLGNMFLMLAVLVFFIAGGPRIFLMALIASFKQLPICSFPNVTQIGDVGNLVIALTSEAIRVGVAIAAPAAIAILLTDVVLGFMNRSAPQVQVFFLGMPVKAVIGVVAALLLIDNTLENFISRLVQVV
jgi:flagellar biosynthetic protein FliR